MQHHIEYEPRKARKPLPIGLLLFVDFVVMSFAALVGHDQDDRTVPHPVVLITAELTVLVTFILFFVLLGALFVRKWRSAKPR